MSAGDKEANRRLIIDQNSWTYQERKRILRYCEDDVDALYILLSAIIPEIDCIEQAFGRSEYMVAMDAINRVGIPMDLPALDIVPWKLGCYPGPHHRRHE